MSKVISVVNMKGGVGKTTLSVALADYIGAIWQKPVCLVDLDAQSNASFAMCGEERYAGLIAQRRTIDHFFLRNGHAFGTGEPLSDFITGQVTRLEEVPNISLVASSPRLRMVERQLLVKLARQNLFDQELEGRVGSALREGFRDITSNGTYVIVDSAPGISGFSVAALKASDLVIAPVNPDYLSRIGLDLLGREILPPIRRHGKPKLVAVLTKLRTGVTYPRRADFEQEAFQGAAGFSLMDCIVPMNADLGRIVEEGDIIQSVSSKYDTGLNSMMQFGSEVRKLLGELDQ